MLFHYTRENKSVKKLKKLINSHLSGEKIITSNSFHEIDHHLKNNDESLKVALFYLSQTKDIEQLLMLKNKLNGTHLILVIPERRRDSLKLTYQLHPLLTCFADGDYSEITGLIQRMSKGDTFMPFTQGGDGTAFFSIWDQEILFRNSTQGYYG
jgi:hypothetical protein